MFITNRKAKNENTFKHTTTNTNVNAVYLYGSTTN